MLERRNSNRIPLKDIWAKEANGDFQFSLEAKNISEEGVFLLKKLKTNDQEAFSQISLMLPNGTAIRNISARMIREVKGGHESGAIFEFLNMSENIRFELKKFIVEASA